MGDPPMDPAIVSAQRPNAVYTRAQLLALHASPLVPTKLDGMKDLAEWHGEFTDPPSPQVQQRHGLPSRPSDRDRDRGERSTPRRLHADASNSSPFANFGRFGVDGGLGEALESTGSRRRARGAGLTDREREADKDVAPHLRGSASGRTGEPSSPTKERRGFELAAGGERERGDRLRSRGVGAGEGAGAGARGGERELRRRDDAELAAGQSRRDVRRGLGPADEGGWRNVGMSREEREKRLIRNQAPPSTAESGRRDRDRGDRGDRGDRERGDRGDRADRDGPSGRSGRPAWMDDDSPSGSGSGGGSSPAWMDAPATGSLSFDGSGHVRDGEGNDNKASNAASRDRDRDRLAKSPLSTFSPSAGKNGMDSLQAFKAQMKERERKDREREMRAAGLPVEEDRPATASESAAQEAAPAKSIFEDLGIARASQPPPGLEGTASAAPPPAAAEGGRGSRFARFFDGKPAGQASPQQAAQQPPASAFSSLLGAAAGANSASGTSGGAAGPSKEDADSMARLLGMLQVSGARSSSPLVGRDNSAAQPPAMSPSPLASQVPSAVASPALTSASTRTADEGRASSRFNFSNKSAVASPATPAAPAAPGLQSPFLAAPAPPPGFGFASPQQQPASSPADTRSPTQPQAQARVPPHSKEEGPRPGGPTHNGLSSPPFSPQGPPPPMPPQGGVPPQFFGQRFPPPPMPGQLPPGMQPPHFGFAPDGRPLPPPPPPPHPGMLPPFASPPLVRPNGPLSPPLASPNGVSPGGPGGGPPGGRPPFFPPGAPQMMFGPGPGPGPGGFMPHGPPPPGGPGGVMPFPPPPPHPHHHLQGRMPPPPPPPPMFTAGGNPGADLMALLNSGASGQRIGGDGPPQGVQVRPM